MIFYLAMLQEKGFEVSPVVFNLKNLKTAAIIWFWYYKPA